MLDRDLADDLPVPIASTEKISWGAAVSTRPAADMVPSPLSPAVSRSPSTSSGQQDVQLLVDLYANTVDEIAQLNGRKKELEAQRNSMEEAIATYAHHAGVHEVIGTTRRIRVAPAPAALDSVVTATSVSPAQGSLTAPSGHV